MEAEINVILSEKGFDFKIKDKQLEIIQSVLEGDTYAVLPTGYGKSVCYCLPPLLKDKHDPSQKHTSLVISPLTSLIKEQVQTLRSHEISAYGIYEGITQKELDDIREGHASIILASPESVIKKHWRDILSETYSERLCLVAYDEAHCISEWGLDFREDYRKVGILQSLLDCPVLTLTATSTKDIKKDICDVLGLSEPSIVSVLPNRPNIMICASKSSEKFEDELVWVRDGIKDKGINFNKTLIYVNSIAMCERVYIWIVNSLKDHAYDGTVDVHHRLIEMYHAHTDSSSKERVTEVFTREGGHIRVLIATIAVGMGIDIPDISIVVILGLPQSLLQFWQEAGRCGRDGRKSCCICYAFPRSIAQPCNSCRKKRQRQCKCSSRVYTRELPITDNCQRIHCLDYFASGKGDYSQIEVLKKKVSCDGQCTSKCSCELCNCCINCMKSCTCPERMLSLEDVINKFTIQ